MRRFRLNLFAALVVAVASALLTAVPAQAGSCTGPAGAQACTCTSGDGQMTCTGDTCTSTYTNCTYKDLKTDGEEVDQLEEGGGYSEQ